MFRIRMIAAVSIILSSTYAGALTLAEYLKMVEEKNPTLRAASMDKESAELKKEIGDLELSPYLSLAFRKFQDERLTFMQVQPPIFGTLSKGTYYGLGVSKKFSTGTNLQLMLSENPIEAETSLGAMPKFYNAAWSVTLSQSLWKNFFGRGTRLRQSREEIVAQIEKTSARLAALQALASAESAFWNAVYLKKEVQVRRDSLSRAKRLLDWTRKRVGVGISQKADLVQVQALQSSRELQLISAEDDERAAQRTLKDLVQTEISAPDLDVEDNFEKKRPELIEEISKPNTMRADAYLADLQAKLQNLVAAEVRDANRPELVLEASYSANGMEDDRSDAIQGALDRDHPNKSIGIRFVTDLDFGARSAVTKSASLSADSAQLKAAKLQQESKSEISEVLRRYEQLSKRIVAATQLAALQKSKFELERGRLENGRSTTFQVINFEQDAAESELMLNKLLTEQRKVEANARLFIREEGSTP